MTATRIGYHPAPGSEEALQAVQPAAEAVQLPNASALFTALETGDVDMALVHVEYAQGGSVAEAYDLMLERPVIVQAESSPVTTGLTTRFLLLAPGVWEKERMVKGDGPGKTLLICTVDHKPGALVRAMSCLARERVNITRLESRPSRHRPGEYLILLEMDGYLDDSHVWSALRELRRLTPFMQILGSYPSASPVTGDSLDGVPDDAAALA